MQDNDVNPWVQDLFEATSQDSAGNNDVPEDHNDPIEDHNDPGVKLDEYDYNYPSSCDEDDYNYPSSSDEDVEDEWEDEMESLSNPEEVIRSWAVNNDAITLAMVQEEVNIVNFNSNRTTPQPTPLGWEFILILNQHFKEWSLILSLLKEVYASLI